jgi:hypothetical protein
MPLGLSLSSILTILGFLNTLIIGTGAYGGVGMEYANKYV